MKLFALCFARDATVDLTKLQWWPFLSIWICFSTVLFFKKDCSRFSLNFTFTESETSNLNHFLSNFTIFEHGNYCVLADALSSNFIPLPGNKALQNITLCTQASLNYLPFLLAQAERWSGPISAALFVPSEEWLSEGLAAVSALRRCHPNVTDSIGASLFYPNSSSPIPTQRPVSNCWSDCELLSSCAASLDFSSFDFSEYPRNVGRNLAKASAPTPLVFVVDIELQPNADFVPTFVRFFRRWSGQSGRKKIRWLNETPLRSDIWNYGVEVNGTLADLPSTTKQLDGLVRSGEAVMFHSAFCWDCHRWPGWELWLHRLQSAKPNKAGILRWVRWHESWEPVYVGWRRGPDWDERFTGAGYNKIQQAFLLCVLGFRFHVMEGLFVTHPGIKVAIPHGVNSTDVSRNRALYKTFRAETRKAFPDGRSCDSWNIHAP